MLAPLTMREIDVALRRVLALE